MSASPLTESGGRAGTDPADVTWMAVGAKEGLELHARGRGAEARELFAAMGDRQASLR